MGDRKPGDNGQLNYIVTILESMLDRMATKDDLVGLATKDDLLQFELRLSAKLEGGITSVRGDLDQLQLRLTSIEKALNTRLN